MKQLRWLIAMLWLFAAMPAFSQRVNYIGKNVQLQTVFAQLEKQCGYSFFYKSELLRGLPRISVRFKNLTLVQALDQCLLNMPLKYTIIEKTVVITAKGDMRSVIEISQDLAISIKGKVTDEQDNVLAGATVTVINDGRSTSTNSAGEFTMRVPDTGNVILHISYVGYADHEFVWKKSASPVYIKLKENAGNLDQVQVIGYGETSKRFNTGNVTTIKSAAIERQPVRNILPALEGRVTGMEVVQNTGLPGGSFTVLIRGQHSMLSSNEPLFIVDGVPYPSGSLPLINTIQQGGNPLNYLDIDAIASVDVLKDADATAIYGSRAANGVVLISTKKGKPGKPSLGLTTYMGVGDVSTSPKMVSRTEYLELRREAKKNDDMPISFFDYDLDGTWDTTNYTNWAKYIRGNRASTFNVHMNLSGGSDNTQYFIGGGYSRQTTVQVENGGDQLGSMLFNVSHAAFQKKLNVTLSGNYSHDLCTVLPVDLTRNLAYMPPTAPLFNEDGSPNRMIDNPFVYKLIKYSNNTDNITGNARVSYKLSKKIELLSTFGYHILRSNEYKGIPRSYYDSLSTEEASATFANYNKRSWIIEPQAHYKTQICGLNVNALLGGTLQADINENGKMIATGFADDSRLHDIDAAGAVDTPVNNYSQYKYNAFFGRIKLAWDKKYLLNLNGRYDGSSRFGPDKQFHFFGSAGAAWIFSEENWTRNNLPFLSFGKLRFSYGTTGNDGFENYAFLDTYSDYTISYLDSPIVYRTRLYNPDLSWELTKKAEVGLELGFLHDRLILNTSYYLHRSSGQLLLNDVSAVTGFSYLYGNSKAVVQNSGLEIELNTTNIKKRNFVWSTSFNITVPRNKLISFPGLENIPRYSGWFYIGKPLGTLQVFKYAGVNPENGLYQFLDKNGNLTQAPDEATDKTAFVSPGTRFYGGLQNNITWGHFSFDVFFSFARVVGYNSFNRFQEFPPGLGPLAMPKELLSRWQKPGDITDVQRMVGDYSMFGIQANVVNSTKAFSEYSVLYCKNLSVAYDLSAKWLQKMRLRTLRFFILAQNLFAFPADGTLDPIDDIGIQSTPPIRVITAGLTMTL